MVANNWTMVSAILSVTAASRARCIDVRTVSDSMTIAISMSTRDIGLPNGAARVARTRWSSARTAHNRDAVTADLIAWIDQAIDMQSSRTRSADSSRRPDTQTSHALARMWAARSA